jgi:hypothetical protein
MRDDGPGPAISGGEPILLLGLLRAVGADGAADGVDLDGGEVWGQ